MDGSAERARDYMGYRTGDAEEADALLFRGVGLGDGDHQLEIVNISNDTGRPVLDINRVSKTRCMLSKAI